MRLIGVEAGGERIAPGRHAARFAGGSTGVLQGTRTFVLQDEAGNIELTHSISAGLDYAAVGPEHAWLRDLGRTEYAHMSDAEALEGFQTLARLEGILPALESAHAIAHAMQLAARRPRRDASSWSISQGAATRTCRAWSRRSMSRAVSRLAETFARLQGRAATARASSPTSPPAIPTSQNTDGILRALDRAGADVLEVGVPFSDPLADGPVIQRATERALASGTTLAGVLDLVGGLRAELRAPIVIFSYANPILRLGAERFADQARDAGVDGVLVLDLPIEEADEFRALLASRGIDTILLLSPTTTDERLRKAATLGSGFLYAISRLGVTGARDADRGRRGGHGPADPGGQLPARGSRVRHLEAGARARSRAVGRRGRGRQRARQRHRRGRRVDRSQYAGRGVCAVAEVLTNIEELRSRIDVIDEQLVRLLNVRVACAVEVGRLKHEAGLPIYQPEREAQVLNSVRQVGDRAGRAR